VQLDVKEFGSVRRKDTCRPYCSGQHKGDTRVFCVRPRPCSGRRRRDACFEGLRPGKQREDALMYTAMFGNMPDPDSGKRSTGWEYWQQPVDTQKARVAVEGSSRYAGEPNPGEPRTGDPSAGGNRGSSSTTLFDSGRGRPVGKRQPWSRKACVRRRASLRVSRVYSCSWRLYSCE